MQCDDKNKSVIKSDESEKFVGYIKSDFIWGHFQK